MLAAGKTQKLYQTGYPVGHAPGQEDVLPPQTQATAAKKKDKARVHFFLKPAPFALLVPVHERCAAPPARR